ncbi:NAD(P)-binding protein [Naviculisporaceae sp. PSN 640]
MVNLSTIKKTLEDLKSTAPTNLTAVVVGGTNGIGKGFLYKLAEYTPSPKIYIVGRKESTLNSIVDDLKKNVNAKGNYIPIIASDLTLLKEVSHATSQILAQETSHLDLLFLSQGYLTLSGRSESPEGLDKITTIRYYGRIRFILDLLPLLKKSPNEFPKPRVISVYNAGSEGKIIASDLGLREPQNNGALAALVAATTYMTLSFERLARDHPKVAFIHSHPGVVRSNIFNAEHFSSAFAWFMNKVIGPTVFRVVAISPEESGERHLWEAVDARFAALEDGEKGAAGTVVAEGSDGKKGSGAYTVNGKCETMSNRAVLKQYRDDGIDGKIWEHTIEELERVKALA